LLEEVIADDKLSSKEKKKKLKQVSRLFFWRRLPALFSSCSFH
jgi:hypothetical protein